MIEPDRDVRGFQSVLLDIGARLGLPGTVNDDGSAKYSDYGDYIVNHQRKPGIGPLAGFRGANGTSEGRGDVTRTNWTPISKMAVSGTPDTEARYYKMANMAYQDFAADMGFCDNPQPYAFQTILETLQKFRLAAEGHDAQPPDHLRERAYYVVTAAAFLVCPLEGEAISEEDYPLHALTNVRWRYHSWGRRIHGCARYMGTTRCSSLRALPMSMIWSMVTGSGYLTSWQNTRSHSRHGWRQ